MCFDGSIALHTHTVYSTRLYACNFLQSCNEVLTDIPLIDAGMDYSPT